MNILSLFTGGGGLDIGFHGGFDYLGSHYPKTGFKTRFAVEINKDACETLYQNKQFFKDTIILNEDITTLDPSLFDGEDIDGIIGGFPCVSFSLVGGRLGLKDDLNGKLYKSFLKFVNRLQPKFFIAENVKGILSANKGEAIRIISQEFQETGYDLQIKSINFANFGVPQLRERVLFIGIRKDIDEVFDMPFFTNYSPVIEPVNPYITVEQAFQNIPIDAPNQEHIKALESTTAKLRAIPEGGNFKDLPPHLSIKAQMSNIYRKLDRKKPAYTVLASGGGGTWTYHYEEPRALTNRERARLQTFPDDYKFYGSLGEVRRQIGNAVPPVGIHEIALSLRKNMI